MQLANKLVPELLVDFNFIRDPSEIRKHLDSNAHTAKEQESIKFIGIEKCSIHSPEPVREKFIRRICLQIDTLRAVKAFLDNAKPGITEENALQGLRDVYLKVSGKLKKEDSLLAHAVHASLHKEAFEISGRHQKGEFFLHTTAIKNTEVQTYQSIFVTAVRLIKAHFECHSDPEQFEKLLTDRLSEFGASRSDADIERKAFWTNVYLKPSQYRPKTNLLGVWNGEICLILRGRNERISKSIREHEEIHARVGFSNESRNCAPHPGEDISRNLTRVLTNESDGASYSKVSDALNISPLTLLRMFKEELVAEFRTFVRNDKNRNFAAWKSFKTASEDCIKFCESVIRFSNNYGKKFPELSEKAMKVARGLADMYEKTTSDIARLSYVSRKLGKQAVDVVEAAMLILPPDKYHRIIGILSRKYGKERVEGIARYYYDHYPYDRDKLMKFAAQRAGFNTKKSSCLSRLFRFFER